MTPSVGNFLLIHFPGTPGRTAQDADAFLSAAASCCAASAPMGCPQALRLTVGTEEANRLVVAALARFHGGGGRCLTAGTALARAALRQARHRRTGADRLVAGARGAAQGPRADHRRGGRVAGRCVSACARSASPTRSRPRRRRRSRGADFVILCVPVGACGAVAAQIAGVLKPGAIVSDVGSVKGAVVEKVTPHLPRGRDTSCRPIRSRAPRNPVPTRASPTLFHNRWCILTPPEGTDPGGRGAVRAFWEARVPMSR